MLILRFLSVVGLVAGGACYFTGTQLAAAFPPWSAGAWGAWAWAATLWAFPLVRMIFFRGKGDPRVQSLGFMLLGTAATLFMGLLALKLSGWLLSLGGYAWPLWAPWAMLAGSGLLMLWGNATAQGEATLKHIKIPTASLHPGLHGLRIVQISDLHVSHSLGAEQVQRLVDQVQALKPDLIAITGDLVDGPLKDLRGSVAPLAQLSAPLGVHYVTGNHEYFWGVQGWLQELGSLGFEMLTNQHRSLDHQGAKLLVLGVNDYAADRLGDGQGPDLAQAMADAPRSDFTLFLAHQPQAYVMAETAKADLFLAGHTHGGQFFPFQYLVGFFHRYYRGLYRHSDSLWVYIHSGSGYWGPPTRLGVPPEIALLELVLQS